MGFLKKLVKRVMKVVDPANAFSTRKGGIDYGGAIDPGSSIVSGIAGKKAGNLARQASLVGSVLGPETPEEEKVITPEDPAIAIAEEKKKNLRASAQNRKGRASTILSQGKGLSASSSLLG